MNIDESSIWITLPQMAIVILDFLLIMGEKFDSITDNKRLYYGISRFRLESIGISIRSDNPWYSSSFLGGLYGFQWKLRDDI